MRHKELTEADFLKSVQDHRLTVFQDNGVYRHLRFAKPGTYCMSFDLITWPGYLCYCGDMGTYVFSRTNDMIDFFRNSGHAREPETLSVNVGYWAEKVQAQDKTDGVTKYSPEKFEEEVRDALKTHGEGRTPKDLWDAVSDEVLSAAEDGEQAAHQAVRDFRFEGKEVFHDFWERSLRVYTYRYLWCCYALAWGIREYDKATKEVAA